MPFMPTRLRHCGLALLPLFAFAAAKAQVKADLSYAQPALDPGYSGASAPAPTANEMRAGAPRMNSRDDLVGASLPRVNLASASLARYGRRSSVIRSAAQRSPQAARLDMRQTLPKIKVVDIGSRPITGPLDLRPNGAIGGSSGIRGTHGTNPVTLSPYRPLASQKHSLPHTSF